MSRWLLLALPLLGCSGPTIDVDVAWTPSQLAECLKPTSQGAKWVNDPWGAEHLILKVKTQQTPEACGCNAVGYTVDAGTLHLEIPIQGYAEDGMTLYLPALQVGPEFKLQGQYAVELSCTEEM